jgi:hypothetical protein
MSKTTARAILLFKDVIEVAIKWKDQIVIGSQEIKDFRLRCKKSFLMI